MSTNLIATIDQMIEQKHLLKHPFYQAWNAGTLSRQILQEYARQYYKHVDAFPRYVSATHSNCEDITIRQQLLENLREEEQGDDNHPALWMKFANALGVNDDDVRSTESLPETNKFVDTFYQLTKEGTALEGITALYCYEAQIPEISSVKIDGLRKFYSVDSTAGLSFFTAHETADKIHRQVGRDMLQQLIRTADDERQAVRAAKQSLDAMWEFLDGIERKMQEEKQVN